MLRAAAIVLAVAVASSSGDDAHASSPGSPFPADTVLLLVAPWCAPCYGELARIETLAVAARPRSLRVMLMDEGPRARAMVRRVPAALQWEPDLATMREARGVVAERSAGLPYSIATDGAGRICADQHGGLDVERMRGLAARCVGRTPSAKR